jgi:hypothetical protein
MLNKMMEAGTASNYGSGFKSGSLRLRFCNTCFALTSRNNADKCFWRIVVHAALENNKKI